jgi:hypothetical protein
MAVFTLAVRVLSPDGEVTAVRPYPFLVLEPGQDAVAAIPELEEALAAAEQEISELEAARHDEHHRHHHWWQA